MSDQNDQSIDRRSVLLGAGTVAAAGVVASFGESPAHAQGRVDQECMTITYQNGADVRFDFDYYVNTHMPRIMSLYGKSISRFELRRGQPGADGAAFDAAQVQHQAGLRADVPKFTNAVLIAQRDRIVGTAAS